jgi:hypothetical protein
MSRTLIKQILKEVLGVPSNLTQTAKEVYEEIYRDIPENLDFDGINNYSSEIDGDFTISDYKFKKIEFSMSIQEHNTLEILGMATGTKSKLTKKFKVKTKIDDTFNISFSFIGPKETTGSDIKSFINKNRADFIGSIGHELKHKYDFSKKRKTSLHSRARYQAISGRGFGNITPINRFIHFLYYTHIVESLVRPSEIAALIDDGDITKKEFVSFLTNTRTYKTLLEIRDFTYEKFKEDIKSEAPNLKKLFDMNNIGYENLSDDEIVELTLRLVYLNIKNWIGGTAHGFLTQHPLEGLFGFRGEKEIFFDNFIKNLEKFGDNYEKFFNYEIKMFHYVSDKMIRKLIKLYDLAK